MKSALATVLLLVPSLAFSQQRPLDPAAVAAVADSIAAEVMKTPVAGIAIGITRGGKVILRRAYGQANVADATPLRTTDVHQIGSLTKQFTAAAVMQLVEQGRISLEDPVQKYLPDFSTQGKTVTVHHLLNHTSGMRSYTSIFGMNAVPRAALLDTIQKHPYDFAPGEKFLYNNSGYYLLGLVLEAVTGVPYARYLEDRFFEPLGMESTSYCGYAGEPVPVGYAPGPDGLTTILLDDMEYPGAGGALCSTVDDLLVWQHALVTGRVVQPASYERMTTPVGLASGEPMNYGYGLGRGSLEGRAVISHGGGIPGFSTNLSYYPADSVGIVVLVNTSAGRPGVIEEPIARAAHNLPRHVIADLPLDAAQRARYLGTYDVGQRQVRIFERDGVLMAQPTGQTAVRMRYQGEHTFQLDAPQAIRLVFDASGNPAPAFTLHQGAGVLSATRIPDGDSP
jgi:D-alanyl-D-alanine carboxypeptidase